MTLSIVSGSYNARADRENCLASLQAVNFPVHSAGRFGRSQAIHRTCGKHGVPLARPTRLQARRRLLHQIHPFVE